MPTFAEPFASGDSFIHRIDPRIRLACAAILTLPTAVLNHIQPGCAALILGVLLVLTARLNLAAVLKRLLVVNVFILFLWLFIPFSQPGTALFSIGFLDATREGLDLCLLITVKSNAIVLILISLLGSIAIQDLGPAMQQLKIPGKLCHLLLFTYRYIFVIEQEYRTMRRAMQARGFTPKTDKHTYRSYAWLVGMLLVRSWDRAERVHNAMRCRGFHGRFHSLTAFTAKPSDFAFAALNAVVISCIVFIEISGGSI